MCSTIAQRVSASSFRDGGLGVVDLLRGEDRVVRVVLGKHEGQRVRRAQELRDGRLDRRQLGGVVAAVAEDVEEQVEDGVLRRLVPRGGQLAIRLLDRGDLPVPVDPRGEHGQEDVRAVPRDVPPARRALVVHRHRITVDPEHVLSQVAQQLESAGVGAGLHPGEDVRSGGGLRLEIAADDGAELLQRVEHREIQVGREIGGKDQTAMVVDHERLHVWRTSVAPGITRKLLVVSLRNREWVDRAVRER
ncbi:hypothetical protein [Pseudonocardia sp. T1-2H]|uniref:hypothetical protein n=1 Tax=Pseudonocardia sp. T1-2H TaxID=3128899 RepID=UPI0031016DD5